MTEDDPKQSESSESPKVPATQPPKYPPPDAGVMITRGDPDRPTRERRDGVMDDTPAAEPAVVQPVPSPSERRYPPPDSGVIITKEKTLGQDVEIK